MATVQCETVPLSSGETSQVDIIESIGDNKQDGRDCACWPTRCCGALTPLKVLLIISLIVGALLLVIVPPAVKLSKDNGPEKKDRLVQPKTTTNPMSKTQCIYHTDKVFLKELENDPFGDDCKYGSEYVNKTCEGSLWNECEECVGKKLPSMCFCDKKPHCAHTEGHKPRDGTGKYNCSQCSNFFSFSKYKNRALECSCPKGRGHDNTSLDCKCKDGYGGYMCSGIFKRFCQLNETVSSLPKCEKSNDEQCRIFVDNRQFICNAFIVSDVDQYKNIGSCGGKGTS